MRLPAHHCGRRMIDPTTHQANAAEGIDIFFNIVHSMAVLFLRSPFEFFLRTDKRTAACAY